MGLLGTSKNTVRFGVFEVNLASAELRKQGLRVQLQEQPFQVLAALLEHPGEVVSRESLIRRLWSDGTNVDFERGLNAAVTRLRQALSDSAETPRYIETVARRGYRFIASIQRAGEMASPGPLLSASRRTHAAVVVIGLSILALTGALWSLTHGHFSRSNIPLKVMPLTSGSGEERNPSFSPDGSQVVYEWLGEDGQRHLYIKVVGSGDAVPLTSGTGAEHGPAWSPDGRLIAFLRPLDDSSVGLFVIPPLGGLERRVAEAARPAGFVLNQFHRRMDWTADSRYLIVAIPEKPAGPDGLLLVSLESGESRWLTRPSGDPNQRDLEPAVSPDGRTIAFVRGVVGGKQTIQLLPLTSNLRAAAKVRPLESAISPGSPAWTPDGKRLVYTAARPAEAFDTGVSVIGLAANDTPRSLPSLGRNAATPAVARTGRMAYSRTAMQANIWRQEVPTHGEANSAPLKLIASTAIDFNAQYSPDGSRIVFASNRSGTREIWTCACDGSHCVQITAFGKPVMTGTPRWSPDGKQIVFDSAVGGNNDTYVVGTSGGSPRRLTGDTTHGFVPSWSHDGRWIYFCSNVTGGQEIWKMPGAGGKAVRVTRNGGYVAFDAPDGQWLYYTKTEENATLFRSAVDGTGETEVLQGVKRFGFVVSADRIYYLHENPDGSNGIRRFMLTTGDDIQVASIQRRLFLGLSLSPDGKYLIYSEQRPASNLMLVEDLK